MRRTHAGVNIVAIHSHMTHENSRILFLHILEARACQGSCGVGASGFARAEGRAFNVNPEDYEQARSAGATVVDVCTAKEFAGGHIPGALNLDVNSPDFMELAAKLDKAKPLRVKEAFHRAFPDSDHCFPARTMFYFSNEAPPGKEFTLADMKQPPEWR